MPVLTDTIVEPGGTRRAASASLVIAARLATLCGCLVITYFVSAGYLSQYNYVAAARGDKSLTEYEQLLRKSLAYNPANGRTSMQLAAYLARQNKLTEAEQLQVAGMRTYRTVSSYEQSGSVQEKLGDGATAEKRAHYYDAARALYEKAERIHPGNVQAIEHLLTLAYKLGDDKLLEEYASRLTRAQPNNLNSVYLRALAAERRGDAVNAVSLLQRISAAGEPAAGALYTSTSIAERLRRLAAAQHLPQ
jgi:cytochrome c-type biogenesis protein CcmH/NrfG